MSMKKLILITLILTSCSDSDKITSYRIDGENAKVLWKGSATDHSHTGSFEVDGYAKANLEGNLTEGEFSIPISSIDNYDLTGDAKIQLLEHLKSTDFFNALKYPKASFKLIRSVPNTENSQGLNQLISGEFTLLGTTKMITFPARVIVDKKKIEVKAQFTLNRTEYGMVSYTDPDEMLYILPEVEIDLNIKGTKVA